MSPPAHEEARSPDHAPGRGRDTACASPVRRGPGPLVWGDSPSIQPLLEPIHGPEKNERPEERQAREPRPEDLETHTLQENPPDDHQEISEGV